MEEVLSGELVEEVGRFANRARELVAELVLYPDNGAVLPDAEEIAATAWRTFQLPEIAALRERLTPERPVYTLLEDRAKPRALAGRIDAIAYAGDRAEVVVTGRATSIRPTRIFVSMRVSSKTICGRQAPRRARSEMTSGLVRWVAGRDERQS